MKIIVSNQFRDLGLFILRVGFGVAFMIHGYPKLMGGEKQWLWLGEQMANLGISVFPMFWGLMAAISEFFGGLLFALGLLHRFAAMMLSSVMAVAIIFHISKGDAFGPTSHAIEALTVFFSSILIGPGKWSLDQFFQRSEK